MACAVLKSRDLLATSGIVKMIMKRKKYSFSRMKFALSRLEGIEKPLRAANVAVTSE